MAAIYLSEADVQELIDMPAAIDVVARAFEELAVDHADNVPRRRARGDGVVLHAMSAAADYLKMVGWKNYVTTRGGTRFLVGLHDQSTGQLTALIEADALGQIRTGATTGVAAQQLAPPETVEVGLFGTGKQARTQLEAICAVRAVQKAFVYSRNEERRETFAEEMADQLKIEVIDVDRPQEAVEDVDVIITATTSREPVFHGGDLSEGTLVCAIGSNWLNRAELDSNVFRRADNVVCDSVECCRTEAGDFSDAIEKGIFDWSRAVDLANVVTGRSVGRSRPESIVVFKSVGMAIEDVALGAYVLVKAKAAGRGVELPF